MAATKEERVEVYIPRAVGKDDPNLFVSVNGVNYLLPRGKKSMVPKHIAAEIHRSQRAEEALNETVDRLLEESKQ